VQENIKEVIEDCYPGRKFNQKMIDDENIRLFTRQGLIDYLFIEDCDIDVKALIKLINEKGEVLKNYQDNLDYLIAEYYSGIVRITDDLYLYMMD